MINVIVTGAASGLGKAICHYLELAFLAQNPDEKYEIFPVDIAHAKDPRNCFAPERYSWPFSEKNPVDIIVNCAGINHQAWLHEQSLTDWDDVMNVNATSMWMMTQYFLSQLKATRGTVLNIVSNAAHVPMRCSLAYNASKAAAKMITSQMARELSSDGITVFSVSPNKLKGTGMSREIERQVCEKRGWTPEEAAAYQKSALLTGEETPPERLAEFIAFLLSDKERHRYLSGCDIPYGL